MAPTKETLAQKMRRVSEIASSCFFPFEKIRQIADPAQGERIDLNGAQALADVSKLLAAAEKIGRDRRIHKHHPVDQMTTSHASVTNPLQRQVNKHHQ
jgi:hypothetical protein